MSRKTRKLIWSAPLVAVLAVAGVLAMFAAQPTGSAQADHIGLPGAPMNVTAEAAETDGHETLILKWEAPEDDGGSQITGYRIDYLPMASGLIWQELTAMTTGTEFTDTHELEAEQTRAYRVFAMNALGTGPTSEVAYGETDMAPEAEADEPGQVTVFNTPTRDGPTKLILNWNEPAKTGSSAITSYRIHFANTAAGIDTIDAAAVTEADDVDDLDFATATSGIIDTGSAATTYTLEGLRARQTWHFVIYARNDSGNSAEASPTRNQTTTDPINPAPPTGLRAVSTDTDPADGGDSLINLYWHWPSHDGGAPIANFRVEVRKSGENWPTSSETLATTQAELNTALAGTDGNGAIDVALPTGGAAQDWQHDASAGDDDATGVLQYRVFAQTALTGAPARRSNPSGMATEAVNAGNSFAVPTGLGLVNGTSTEESQLSLTWTAPTGYTGTGYRLDYAETGTGTPQWKELEVNTIFARLPYVHGGPGDEALAAGNYRYRVSAKPDSRGLAAISSSLEVTAPTPPAITAPDAPQNLMVNAVNAGQIDLSWDAPDENGGSEITGYRVHITNDPAGAALANDTAVSNPVVTNFEDTFTTAGGAVFDAKKELTFSVKGLRAQQTWTVAVTAHNSLDATADPPTFRNSDLSSTAIVTMPMFDVPAMPVGLVAESAVDTNLRGVSKQGVLLMWNSPEAPAGAEITAYEVQRSVNGEDYEALFTLSEAAADPNADPPLRDLSTFDTDEDPPAADEYRMYQVRTVAQAVSGADQEQLKSEWAEVRFPTDDMMTPGAPVLTAMKDAAMPATQINLTWTKPDNAYATVTGYIIERAYGDVMFLDADDGVAHPDFAFSNHMQWWETLNCAGMLNAVGSSETMVETPAADSDQAKYCAHYDMTAPSNTAGTIMAGSDVDMKIEEYFDKRYQVITGAATVSYMDTGLMENTEYSYRVRAAHGMDAGAWSNTAMAMTETGNSDPMRDGTIPEVMLRAGEMSSAINLNDYFMDADDDTLTYTVAVMPADGSIATAELSGGDHTNPNPDDRTPDNMLTITGVAAGEATITVTASDGMGGTDAEQTIMVTVTRGALTAPMNVMASHDGLEVTVTWDGGMNADTFYVALLRRDAEGNWDIPNAVYDAAPSGSPFTVNMATRPAGTYLVFVTAGSAEDGWSNWISGSLDYAP